MYIYHALINALSAHMIHINLNRILHTHVKHSPTKTICIKYYLKIIIIIKTHYKHAHACARTHTECYVKGLSQSVMSQSVMLKDCVVVFKIKVTVRARII